MDYNTATAQECADWLACDDGWTKVQTAHGDYAWRHSTLRDDPCSNWSHPYPLTLDAAAGALRSNWRVDYIRDRGEYAGLGDARWYARVFRVPGDITNSVSCEGPDELTARYRAAVASKMEGGKA